MVAMERRFGRMGWGAPIFAYLLGRIGSDPAFSGLELSPSVKAIYRPA
jgi:hypothetical protein